MSVALIADAGATITMAPSVSIVCGKLRGLLSSK